VLEDAVTARALDPELPGLEQALNVPVMLPVLVAATGLDETWAGARARPSVLSHKPGQRCTVGYTLEDGARARAVRVAVKVYRRQRLASRVHGWTNALKGEIFHDTRRLFTPAALELIEEQGISVCEWVDGVDLRHPLLEERARLPVTLAAQWLAILHAARPLGGLKTHSLQHELHKVDEACGLIGAALPGERRGLEQTQEEMRRAAAGIRPYRLTMIHRDFYYAHVLWNGARVGVIDFDSLSVGDPALDVGHFLAHLETLAYRRRENPAAFSDEETTFLEIYNRLAEQDIRSRVNFFKTYTFLKLAGIEVGRKSREWRRQATALTALAVQESEFLAKEEPR
jgi:aminoglycoside phosphotransferase (APT) family kinase protein